MLASCRAWAALAVIATTFSPWQTIAEEAIAEGPAALVADGQPWSMRTAAGKELRLTLFADGTGLIEGGLVSLTPKWRSTADGLCMTPNLLLGERCVVLEPDMDGYVARRDGDVSFRLTR